MAAVCDRFGLGMAVTPGMRVAGYHHNDVWRIDTITGAYAVKRMGGPPPGSAVAIELAALAAGVQVPAPVASPDGGAYATELDGAWVRVHRWLDGRGPTLAELTPELAQRMGALLADVHRAGSDAGAEDAGGSADAGGDGRLGSLLEVTERPEGAGTVVRTHGDLHPKNVLLRVDGSLALIDWDTAGAYVAEQEAAGVALDWAARLDGGVDLDRFDAAVRGYGGLPAEPWVFGGWVRGYLGFLGRAEGDERDRTLDRLTRLAEDLPRLVSRLS